MDRFEGTSNIIKAYYQFKRNGNNAEFVSKVCEYFNCIKSDKLDGSDLNFLSFIASEAGVPQYYDMLIKRQNRDESLSIMLLMRELKKLAIMVCLLKL